MADGAKSGHHNNAFEIEEPQIASSRPADKKTDLNGTEVNVSDEKAQISSRRRHVLLALKLLTHAVAIAYFIYATYYYLDLKADRCNYDYGEYCEIRFCNGYGMLVLIFCFAYIGMFYYQIFKPRMGRQIYRHYLKPFNKWWMEFSRTRLMSAISIVVVVLVLGGFLAYETWYEPRKLVALITPTFFILVGWLFSTQRSAIQWRTVFTGITCQFILGILCIRWKLGRQIFECIGSKVTTFLDFTQDGALFVYGDRIVKDAVFAFAILATIFFFSFFISILYYMNIMQWIVMKMGWLLQQILTTTVCESVNAAANIFLGMSESPLLIRPYIKVLTASEIHSIMVSGFATVSGTVLAAYLSYGANAAHLITASVMAAPASLALSKLYLPETEESRTSSSTIQLEKSEHTSILDAASSGAINAIPIVHGIVANIVAFVAFVAFLNALFNWFSTLIGWTEVDFEWLFSKIFIPLAWSMGVPWYDCDKVAKVIATKMIINEFVAYERLGVYIKDRTMDARSIGIATFAICGFANPSSLGILIGALGALAPHRRSLITRVAFRAFIVGSIVCFVSASFAGILMVEEEEYLLYTKFLTGDEGMNTTLG